MRMIFYINYSSKQINILYTASKKRTPRTAWVRKIDPNSIIRVSDTGKAETRADLPVGYRGADSTSLSSNPLEENSGIL
jgi:hypothetical protein